MFFNGEIVSLPFPLPPFVLFSSFPSSLCLPFCLSHFENWQIDQARTFLCRDEGKDRDRYASVRRCVKCVYMWKDERVSRSARWHGEIVRFSCCVPFSLYRFHLFSPFSVRFVTFVKLSSAIESLNRVCRSRRSLQITIGLEVEAWRECGTIQLGFERRSVWLEKQSDRVSFW